MGSISMRRRNSVFSLLVYYLKCLPFMENPKVRDEEDENQLQERERKPRGWKTMPYILGLSLSSSVTFLISNNIIHNQLIKASTS